MTTKSSRRQILKAFLFIGATSALSKKKTAHSQEKKGTVLIVGAGISGIAAGRILQDNGYEVTVIEGRDRIGGRIWTDRSLGIPLDFGASWIHQTVNNPITDLIQKFKIPFKSTNYENQDIFLHTGETLSEELADELSETADLILEEVEALADDLEIDISLGEAVRRVLEQHDLSEDELRYLNWTIADHEANIGVDFDEASLFGDDGDIEDILDLDGEDVLFPNGYIEVVEHLAEGLDIHLNQTVLEVIDNGNSVQIVTAKETFNGDRVILTFPLGVLKSGSITFTPPLPEHKQKAIQNLGMGLLNKFALKFPEVFWDDEVDFIEHISEEKGMYHSFLCWNQYTGQPVLLGFLSGTFARIAETLTDEEIQIQAMQTLRKIYGNSIPEPVAIAVTRWSQDLFAFGSYSYQPVGVSGEAYDILAEPTGNLHFAGESTHRGHYSTVHGAFLSGVREAERILDDEKTWVDTFFNF